jgi:hypothetical protein
VKTLLLVAALAQAVAPAWTTIAQGRISGIDERREVVVRSAAEWDALWRQHSSSGAAPAVDFSTEMVAAIFLGTRPTGGYSLDILSAAPLGGALIVEYTERRPGGDAIVTQVLTAPFHMIRLPRFDGPVRFSRATPAPVAAR